MQREKKNYSLPSELINQVRRESDRTGLKQSTIVEKAITEYLAKISTSHTKATALE